MKKEIFNHYCTWLFDILQHHEQTFDFDHYDVQSYRVSGYLAERLTGLYITWLKMQNKFKIKEVQTIMFDNVDKKTPEISYDCKVLLKTNQI